MKRTALLQEIRKMRFEEASEGWQKGRLRQEEVARLLGVCERTFRRYIDRFEDAGLKGLIDRRLEQVSTRRAPVDEVMHLAELYRHRYLGWNGGNNGDIRNNGDIQLFSLRNNGDIQLFSLPAPLGIPTLPACLAPLELRSVVFATTS